MLLSLVEVKLLATGLFYIVQLMIDESLSFWNNWREKVPELESGQFAFRQVFRCQYIDLEVGN